MPELQALRDFSAVLPQGGVRIPPGLGRLPPVAVQCATS